MSRITPRDHRALTRSPTIPIIGSLQFQPHRLPVKRAAMARTEVSASARTGKQADPKVVVLRMVLVAVIMPFMTAMVMTD